MKKNKKNRPKLEKKTLGWREWVTLPHLSAFMIKAKVDSGAKTSALHARNIQFQKKHGKTMVYFEMYPAHRPFKRIRVHAEMIDRRTIKSSIGHTSDRPVIQTDILIGEDRFPIELTLVNRSMMGYRMLLGRQALKRRYIINPGRSFLMNRTKKT